MNVRIVQKMNISLDYDDTWTRDPDLWNAFAVNAVANGHTVYGVTMRYPREADGMDPRYKKACNGGILFTSRESKWYYTRNQDILIDVWIDDSPHFIMRSAK